MEVIERAGNQIMSAQLGVEGAYMYGPLIFPSALVSELSRVPEDLGWGTNVFMCAVARQRAMPLLHTYLDVVSPEDVQQGGEAIRLRLTQLIDVLATLRRALSSS